MAQNPRNLISAFMLLLFTFTISCASTSGTRDKVAQLFDSPEIVQIPIMLTPTEFVSIPEGSRIVIADISGECADEVKDALMRRFITNPKFDVLTRDNLQQILFEANLTWAGDFNTETAVKLGNLMGASLWIVGRVAYCGAPYNSFIEAKQDNIYKVFATLQVIDLATGKLLVSSSSEGTHIPRKMALLDLASTDTKNLEDDTPKSDTTSTGDKVKKKSKKLFDQAKDELLKSLRDDSDEPKENKNTGPSPAEQKQIDYALLRAADDMASGFADKFFSRPTWDTVEMWENPRWEHERAIRYVKLGHCPLAVEVLRTRAAPLLDSMHERATSEYLHNLGISLLCANQPFEAIDKLRAAYRLSGSESSFRMLGLASKIAEWAVEVEVEEEPAIDRFLPMMSR